MRLLVALTGHGYGHAAQTAPVVEALAALRPDLELHLRSDLDPAILRSFFPTLRGIERPVGDFGMAMHSAFAVDAAATGARYARLHAEFPAAVAAEAQAIAALAPDLMLANVGYLPLAAAARAGVPAAGMSSLNWLGIYKGFCADRPEAPGVIAEMTDSYRAARLFLTPEPSMPMPEFPTEPIGPIARQGTDRRQEIARRLGLAPGERVVLVSLGGIATALPLQAWPRLDGVRYIVAGGHSVERPDMVPLDRLGISHLDCLASADAILTKPGYGSVVEAAVHGLPILYARRGDWPEEPAVVDWMTRTATAREIDRGDLDTGDLGTALEALWRLPRRPPVPPTGAGEAAQHLLRLL